MPPVPAPSSADLAPRLPPDSSELNLLALLGVGISFSFGAYAVSTGAQIPSYITSTIQPWEDYFNPLTASFFAISILLGSFKVAQLSSGDNEYVEYIEDE